MGDDRQSVGAGDALTDLLATAQTLLRGSISERAQVRPSNIARPGPEQLTFGLAPNAQSPRLLVPLVPKRAAGNALRRFSTATPLREAAFRALVSKAVSLMPGRVLRDQISIESGRTGLADHLSDVLGEQVTLSLGIGNARVNRKPVLQVFDRRGNTVAFAKIGDSDVGRQDVKAEGRALRAARRTAVDSSSHSPAHIRDRLAWHAGAIDVRPRSAAASAALGPLGATTRGDV